MADNYTYILATTKDGAWAAIREEWCETCRLVHAGEIDSYDYPWWHQLERRS